ncbi:MAG: RNA polymerase sigma factor [Verrucomicrobiota bacterium]
MSEESTPLADEEEDRRLMGLVAAGDDDALRLLVHRHHARLIGYLRSEVGSQATAEELAMEVFIRLHRAAGRWRPEAKLSTYLIHIARNLVLNEWRRRSRKPTSALESAPEPGDAAPESGRRVLELEEAFSRAVAQLPEEQRTAILLLVQQEMPYEEIASVMGCPVSSVKTWIHRARTRLKELMRDFYGPES